MRHHDAESGACLYRFRTDRSPALACRLLLPSTGMAPDRLLVSVHGISRNDREHLQAFAPFAISQGVALLVPRFGRNDFRDYQRLGRRGRGPRADLALLQAIQEIEEMFGWELPPFDLFGFSGGAQFAHRFALVHPEKIRRLALGAAGWYSWPDVQLRYPLGVGPSRDLPETFDLPALLRKQILVLVGERDRHRDPSLNTRERIDRLQGGNRFERARNWVEVMRHEALKRGLPPRVTLEILPGVGHDFGRMVRRGGLAQRLFQTFYERDWHPVPVDEVWSCREDRSAGISLRLSAAGEMA